MEDEEKVEETEVEEGTEDKTEEKVEEKVDYETLYKSAADEIERLKREVTDLREDKERLERQIEDATRAFSILADRVALGDVDVVDGDGDGYVEVIDEDDFDKFIEY